MCFVLYSVGRYIAEIEEKPTRFSNTKPTYNSCTRMMITTLTSLITTSKRNPNPSSRNQT